MTKILRKFGAIKRPKPWAAMRLKNGNTLITDETESRTFEVNNQGETVWNFDCKN